MNRVTQNLILTLLGCAVLRISAFSTTYLNYVKPGFRPFLIGAGTVLVVLGVIGVFQAYRLEKGAAERETHGHAHGHAHGGPRVAWLMCLPVFAIFLIAPPALGSFAASRDDTPPPRDQTLNSFTPLTGAGPVDMPIGEFIGRAWDDDKKSLTGREVRLTGFVVPAKRKGQWYVTRMQIACCAADAFPLKVSVRGLEMPPADTWVEVTGTWIPQTFGKMPNGVIYPRLTGKSLTRVTPPDEPYE
ncbi:TIGR03943 family protein [Streptosporangium sp. NBC_01810]|uniref:TIGR03943 family putative permease subunit n=1 Tax=Streptosporangium sp. NBC_01810 TaxID=2975951 RepID=UPI002DD9CD2C|nr:TIGR03943 family protein [Streptosporangium sp. NBC_01810]WSA25116.1 TIGR03943 family protein [Streptosporangium sp. NBC_01810]